MCGHVFLLSLAGIRLWHWSSTQSFMCMCHRMICYVTKSFSLLNNTNLTLVRIGDIFNLTQTSLGVTEVQFVQYFPFIQNEKICHHLLTCMSVQPAHSHGNSNYFMLIHINSKSCLYIFIKLMIILGLGMDLYAYIIF